MNKSHAVIAVAEGAGQDLLDAEASERDASGNLKLKDIGPFLCEKIKSYFKSEGIPVVIRYFDPSYQIRSRPANSEDALLCDLFARHAVHAAMAGKTGVVIGFSTRALYPCADRVARYAHKTTRPRRRLVALGPRCDRTTGTIRLSSPPENSGYG